MSIHLFRIAQEVTDNAMGQGSYVRLNGFDPSAGETRKAASTLHIANTQINRLGVSSRIEAAKFLTIAGRDVSELVRINLATGQVTLADGADVNEAARLFWDAIWRMHPVRTDEAVALLREIAAVAYPNGGSSDWSAACDEAKEFIARLDAQMQPSTVNRDGVVAVPAKASDAE